MSTESIWNDFSERLENFILSKVNDPVIAQDLLQDVFVKIHLKKEALQDDSKLTSWLYQITRNAIIDHYRKKKVDPDKLLIEQENQEENLFEDNLSLHHCLKPYIEELPEKYKSALILTAFKNVSQKELAKQQNISYTAAKTRVQRARKMVKQQIIDCCNPTTDKYGNVISKEPCKASCGCED